MHVQIPTNRYVVFIAGRLPILQEMIEPLQVSAYVNKLFRWAYTVGSELTGLNPI